MRSLISAARDRWAIAVKPRRHLQAVRCLGPLRSGASVVIVNWESLEFLRQTVDRVRRYSPAGTTIIVVDNGSADGSAQWLRDQPDIKARLLPKNIGHAGGLDIGFASVRTGFAIALDVDAFPIRVGWIDTLTDPIRRGARLSGWPGGDNTFVHPCALAIRTRRFALRRHTFAREWEGQRLVADCGVNISRREAPNTSLLKITDRLGPGAMGQVAADAVYHNGYSVRHKKEHREEIDGLTAADAADTWRRAIARFP